MEEQGEEQDRKSAVYSLSVLWSVGGMFVCKSKARRMDNNNKEKDI